MGSASSPVTPIAAPVTTLLRQTIPERLETRTTNYEEASEGPHRESDYYRHGIKRAAQQRWWQWWWWRWWRCLGLSKLFWERGPRTSAGAARVYETAGGGAPPRFNKGGEFCNPGEGGGPQIAESQHRAVHTCLADQGPRLHEAKKLHK